MALKTQISLYFHGWQEYTFRASQALPNETDDLSETAELVRRVGSSEAIVVLFLRFARGNPQAFEDIQKPIEVSTGKGFSSRA